LQISWSQPPAITSESDSPYPFWGGAAAFVEFCWPPNSCHHQQVAVFGGGSTNREASAYTKAVSFYDFATGSWNSANLLSDAKYMLSAAVLSKKPPIVVFAGGGTWDPPKNNYCSRSVDLVDPQTRAISFVAGNPKNNHTELYETKFAMTSGSLLPYRSAVYFAGGWTCDNGRAYTPEIEIFSLLPTDDSWGYYVATDRSHKLPVGRAYLTSTTVDGSSIYFAGGIGASGLYDSIDRLDLASGRMTSTPILYPRQQLSSTSLGPMLVFSPGRESGHINLCRDGLCFLSSIVLQPRSGDMQTLAVGKCVAFYGGSNSDGVPAANFDVADEEVYLFWSMPQPFPASWGVGVSNGSVAVIAGGLTPLGVTNMAAVITANAPLC